MLTRQDEVQVRTYSGTEVRFITYKERGYLEMIIDNGVGDRVSLLMNEADIDEVCKAMWISAETAVSGRESESDGTQKR
jgi:hypothetical protein